MIILPLECKEIKFPGPWQAAIKLKQICIKS